MYIFKGELLNSQGKMHHLQENYKLQKSQNPRLLVLIKTKMVTTSDPTHFK